MPMREGRRDPTVESEPVSAVTGEPYAEALAGVSGTRGRRANSRCTRAGCARRSPTPSARLPDRERVVITLRDVEGHSPAAVCSILNIAARQQRLLLHSARAFVRARLEEYFNTRHPMLGPGSDPEPT